MPSVHLWLNLCRLARCQRAERWSWLRQGGRVWTDVGLLIVRVLVCVWVRACYWQEVQLLTEGLVRARVQASALTDNFPLRGSAHSGDTHRPWPLCLDVSPLLYLTARLYSLCNLIKWCIHLQRASEDLCHFSFMALFACFPLSQCISISLFLCTFFDSLMKIPIFKHRKLYY